MAELVYISCASMSVACALFLLRAFRKNRSHLLFWSSVCFGLLAVNNGLLFFDMMIVPEIDIHGPLLRNFLSAGAGSVLLGGLIREMTQ